MKAKYKLGKMK